MRYQYLTAGQLRQALENVKSDAPVVIDCEDGGTKHPLSTYVGLGDDGFTLMPVASVFVPEEDNTEGKEGQSDA